MVGINEIIIPIFIKVLMYEYTDAFFIFSIVTRKSNIIINSAKIEGIIKIIPNCPQSFATILCKPSINPINAEPNDIKLHIIDIIFLY